LPTLLLRELTDARVTNTTSKSASRRPRSAVAIGSATSDQLANPTTPILASSQKPDVTRVI
jgi:hypothetical protein